MQQVIKEITKTRTNQIKIENLSACIDCSELNVFFTILSRTSIEADLRHKVKEYNSIRAQVCLFCSFHHLKRKTTIL